MEGAISFLAEYFYLSVTALAVGLVLLRYRSHFLKLAMAGVCIGVISYLLAKVMTGLISDPRPFIETGTPALIKSATDNSFPSDHTLFLAVIAATLALVSWRTGLVFLVLTLVVGLARVYARVHHLLDVAGSLVIVALALGGYLLGNKLYQQWRKRKQTAQVHPE